MILERLCNIFSIIKQTSHKASGAEEKELPAKFFRGESCAAPAAGRRNPVALPPLPRGRRDTGGWFWDFSR